MDVTAMSECARLADTAGPEPVTLWLPESPGDRHAFTTAATLLARTERARIGTGVVPIPLRPTIDVLAAAMTVAETFPGRFDLGVGSGNVASLGAAGVPVTAPPLDVARGFLDAYATLRQRSGVATLVDVPVAVEPPPVLLAAHNKQMINLAVTRADGVILNMVAQSDLDATVAHATRCAGRASTRPRLGLFVPAAFGALDDALAAVRQVLAGFLRAPAVRKRLHAFGSRHADLAERIAASPPVADNRTLASVISDDVVTDFGVVSEQALGERLAEAARLGFAFAALSVFPAPLRLRKAFPPVPEPAAALAATRHAIEIAARGVPAVTA
jgi:alkanesulfonate monooxygenase SsuD/methylene tetrahydromethanopterin reductase-like flavin-dependent oxidoreductase (luciferase family)